MNEELKCVTDFESISNLDVDKCKSKLAKLPKETIIKACMGTSPTNAAWIASILEKNDEFIRRINLIKEGPLIWFFSEEKKSSDFVGYVMLQDEGDAIALGFALTASKQHMGYGFEMVESVINMLFDSGVAEIRIKTWEKNLPCQKLADKLGFIKTDVVKGKHKDPVTGETSDDYLYSLKRRTS